MAPLDLLMLAITVVGGVAALLVVTARNVVHAALWLVVALVAVAGSFLALGAEFLAWAQVLVYVGAVVVLLLFALMLTRAPIGPVARDRSRARPALVAAVALFVALATVIATTLDGVRLDHRHVTAGDLGEVLFVEWALPVLALGLLLTVALVAAVALARREEGEGPIPPDAVLADDRDDHDPGDATGAPSAGPAGDDGASAVGSDDAGAGVEQERGGG